MQRIRIPALSLTILFAAVWAAPLLWSQSPADTTTETAETRAAAVAIDRQLIEGATSGSEIMQNLTYMSDIIGPRLTGSANLRKANEWAVQKMKGYGLTNARLEGWELPIGWERGSAYAKIIEPDNGRTLTIASRGWSPGTNGKVVSEVVIIKGASMKDLRQYEGKLKDAVVMLGPPADLAPITELDTYFTRRSRRRAAQAAAAKGAEKAKSEAKSKEKAKGFDTRPQSAFAQFGAFRRERTEFFKKEGVVAILQDSNKPHGLLSMTGSWPRNPRDRAEVADILPTLVVTHDHYALLHRLASRPAPAKTRIELEVDNKFIPGPIPVYNAVGEIKGSEKPDEFVVLGAHIDSWDLGQGTTDNGTGCCVVLEAARIIARSGIKPKRTIRFALFSGEEQGLHGSREYVKLHKDEMDRTSLCLVHDTGTGRVQAIGCQGRKPLVPIMERELVSLKELGVTDINDSSFGGSDHISFERAGVPGLIFRQDPAEYRLTHHTQSDTLDKAREEDIIQGAQVMAVIAVRVANLDELLPREKE